MTYDNTNKGVLFRNERKETEKQPDYTGKINVNGKDLQLAAWIRDGKNGKFMSLAVSEPRPKQERSTAPPADELDDEIPF